jgi:hypothetical protein
MNGMFPRSLVLAYRGRLVDENTLRATGKPTMNGPSDMRNFDGAIQQEFVLIRKAE